MNYKLMIIAIIIMVFALSYYLLVGRGGYSIELTKGNVTQPVAEKNEIETAGEEKTQNRVTSKNSLDLSGRDLEKLPPEVISQEELETLDISNNQLTGALPSQIEKLTNLKALYASNNDMTGVPAEIGKLTKLEILDLSDNKLTGLPNELGNLKNLKILNLSGNDYSEQDLEIIKKGLPSDVQLIL